MRLDEVEAALERLPRLHGHPLRIYFGEVRGADGGADIPRRFIVLDPSLSRRELRRVLIHEMFHFVWARLGNPRRWSWEELLRRESGERVRGELGWSSEWRRRELNGLQIASRDRKWREYACESFCDTAAYVYSGIGNPDRMLARRFQDRRRQWFRNQLESRGIVL